jgi:hypothetical protein
LVETDVVASPGWSLFARAIAASFLTLAGVGLALAHGDGVRWRAFLRPLGIVAGAALGVTLATWVVFPDTFVFFGILHCIAASSLLALLFSARPSPSSRSRPPPASPRRRSCPGRSSTRRSCARRGSARRRRRPTTGSRSSRGSRGC